MLCQIHKTLIRKTPSSYLYKKIIFRNDIYEVNTRGLLRIEVLRHSTEKFKHSFTYLYTMYNDLSDDIQRLSLNMFRSALRDFLLKAQRQL